MLNNIVENDFLEKCRINDNKVYEARKTLILLKAKYLKEIIIPSLQIISLTLESKDGKIFDKRVKDYVYDFLKEKGIYVSFKSELPYRFQIYMAINDDEIEQKYNVEFDSLNHETEEFEKRKMNLFRNIDCKNWYLTLYGTELEKIINEKGKIYVNYAVFKEKIRKEIEHYENLAKDLEDQYFAIDIMIDQAKQIEKQVKEFNKKYHNDIKTLFDCNLRLVR